MGRFNPNTIEESKEGRDCLCATLCFDGMGQDLVNRISNKVYESARQGDLHLANFPSFDPLLSALKNGTTVEGTKSYRVSCQRHDQLVLLESFCRKWLDNPNFVERAQEVIKNHNDEYNPSGDFALDASDRRDLGPRGKNHETSFLKLFESNWLELHNCSRLKSPFPLHLPTWNHAGMRHLAMVMSLKGLPSESNWRHARARKSQSCPTRSLFDFKEFSYVSIVSTIHPRS